jgi:glycosyltransferase involved in cell wall biosynthesis
MSVPFFSVIMPTFNRRDSVRHCLESLGRQSFPMSGIEVIVAVDGSTDGTAKVLRALELPYSLTVVELENEGPGSARNAAAACAKGIFLACTEDDVSPSVTWLEQAHNILKDDAWDVLEGHTGYPGTQKSVRNFERRMTASFIPCNLFVRRDLFVRVGGYSPEFFDRAGGGLYFREDSDLGFRLQDAGARVHIDETLLVIHPPQFQSMRECFRHARRYRFDALLFRRHPRRYREVIEVKTFGSFTVRRAQQPVALLDLAAVIATIGSAATGNWMAALFCIGVVIFCGWLFRCKYQGIRGLRLWLLHETAGFTLLPFVYLEAVLRGCIKYRTAGILW